VVTLEFDFDQIEEWGPRLGVALTPHLPPDIEGRIAGASPEHTWDARDLILSLAMSREDLLEAGTEWIRSQHVIAYHGSRLTPSEVGSVKVLGIRTLRMSERAERLRPIFSLHPNWPALESGLAPAIAKMATGEQSTREGQVHLTLSRCGLLHSFNHYLVEGSEFDGHVALMVLGRGGRDFISQHGVATVFRLRVPGDRAMQAMNPFGMFSSEPPNPLNQVIGTWAYWMSRPGFSSASLELDCGLMFWEDLPVEWIVGSESVDDATLRQTYRR